MSWFLPALSLIFQSQNFGSGKMSLAIIPRSQWIFGAMFSLGVINEPIGKMAVPPWWNPQPGGADDLFRSVSGVKEEQSLLPDVPAVPLWNQQPQGLAEEGLARAKFFGQPGFS